jgi:hypothetical protein
MSLRSSTRAAAAVVVAALLLTTLCRAAASAPWFRLKTITGQVVTPRTLRGRPAVLVVGLTYASAPPCKKWVIELTRHTRAQVYQVIVADKPWYIPRFVVMRRIKSFTPPRYHHRVMVEWQRTFADRYQVPESDEPTLFVVDGRGRVQLRLSGRPDKAKLARVQRLVARLK